MLEGGKVAAWQGIRRELSSAHKVHDLELVPVVQFGGGPLSACHDLAVQFHGNAIALHSKRLNQRGDVRNRRELFLFTIDHQFHVMPKITPTRPRARIASDCQRGFCGALQRKLDT